QTEGNDGFLLLPKRHFAEHSMCWHFKFGEVAVKGIFVEKRIKGSCVCHKLFGCERRHVNFFRNEIKIFEHSRLPFVRIKAVYPATALQWENQTDHVFEQRGFARPVLAQQ